MRLTPPTLPEVHQIIIEPGTEREETLTGTLKGNVFTVSTPPEPEWEYGDRYFYISPAGEVNVSVWHNDTTDRARRDFLGIYRTRTETEAVAVKVKAVVNK